MHREEPHGRIAKATCATRKRRQLRAPELPRHTMSESLCCSYPELSYRDFGLGPFDPLCAPSQPMNVRHEFCREAFHSGGPERSESACVRERHCRRLPRHEPIVRTAVRLVYCPKRAGRLLRTACGLPKYCEGWPPTRPRLASTGRNADPPTFHARIIGAQSRKTRHAVPKDPKLANLRRRTGRTRLLFRKAVLRGRCRLPVPPCMPTVAR